MTHIELPRALEDYFAFAEIDPTRNWPSIQHFAALLRRQPPRSPAVVVSPDARSGSAPRRQQPRNSARTGHRRAFAGTSSAGSKHRSAAVRRGPHPAHRLVDGERSWRRDVGPGRNHRARADVCGCERDRGRRTADSCALASESGRLNPHGLARSAASNHRVERPGRIIRTSVEGGLPHVGSGLRSGRE